MNLNKDKAIVAGEAMDLTKDNPGLVKVSFGAGWDLSQGADAFDLDIFAIPTNNAGQFTGSHNHDIVFYNNMKCHGMELDKDNRDGDGEGDDETIAIDLSKIPAIYDSVYLGINIYNGAALNQRFGQIQNSYIRLYDPSKGTGPEAEAANYSLRGDFKKFTAVIMGRLFRSKGAEWEFEAIGKGSNGTIEDIANSLPTIKD